MQLNLGNENPVLIRIAGKLTSTGDRMQPAFATLRPYLVVGLDLPRCVIEGTQSNLGLVFGQTEKPAAAERAETAARKG